MRRIFRAGIIVLALYGFGLPEARAERAEYCITALERCLVQCDKYPTLFREGCMIGCGIGFLNCD